VIHFIPSNSQEWFMAVLRPFKAYTFIGFLMYHLCWLCRGPGVGEVLIAVVILYLLSVPILVAGGLVQLYFGQRKAAVPAILFAGCDVVLIAYISPALVSA
jgi:hypothetical protein